VRACEQHLVVADEDVGTFGEHFAVVGDRDLDARERRAGRACVEQKKSERHSSAIRRVSVERGWRTHLDLSRHVERRGTAALVTASGCCVSGEAETAAEAAAAQDAGKVKEKGKEKGQRDTSDWP
jgi:hypothetical protein